MTARLVHKNRAEKTYFYVLLSCRICILHFLMGSLGSSISSEDYILLTDKKCNISGILIGMVIFTIMLISISESITIQKILTGSDGRTSLLI